MLHVVDRTPKVMGNNRADKTTLVISMGITSGVGFVWVSKPYWGGHMMEALKTFRPLITTLQHRARHKTRRQLIRQSTK